MWPVELISHSIVHARLAVVFRQFRVVFQVEEGRSKQFGTTVCTVQSCKAGQTRMPRLYYEYQEPKCPNVPFTCREKASLACSVTSSFCVGGPVFALGVVI